MGETHDPGVLARRLEHLFTTVHPRDRGPYTLREVAEAINETAGEQLISAAYLSQLRNGIKTEPSHSRLLAIAKFFGVDVAYFSDEQVAERTDEQLALLVALKDQAVREIATRAAGLSTSSLSVILGVIENTRRLEGLADDTGPPTEASTEPPPAADGRPTGS
jgi:transcriptional regulator with XRE-family HTH domain